MTQPPSDKSKVNITPTAKVCRKLLPVNHNDVRESLNTEYHKNIMEKSAQWNYDFENSEPLNKEYGFQWVECNKVPVPKPRRRRLLATSDEFDFFTIEDSASGIVSTGTTS